MKTLWSLLLQLRESWQQRHQLNEKRIARQELAFLPGALEIQETPPAPWGRIVAWLLMALFTIAILWSVFSHVDVVTTAEGQIIASGRIKQIQPFDKGTIKKILVKEGQQVKQGEPLVELDQSLTHADEQRLENELHLSELELLRHQALTQLLTQHKMQLKIKKSGWTAKIPDKQINSHELIKSLELTFPPHSQWHSLKGKSHSLSESSEIFKKI